MPSVARRIAVLDAGAETHAAPNARARGREGLKAPRLAFLFIGGQHQFLHTAPVAAFLARSGAAVTVFTDTPESARALSDLMHSFGAGQAPVEAVDTPRVLGWARAAFPRWRGWKLVRLARMLARVRDFDAVITPERTSTLMKRLPLRTPMMIHIPHGVGDRAQGFERRIALFDHVITGGEKDRLRMIAEGLTAPERCASSGYVKLEAVRRLRGGMRPRLFDNDRPVVLYNPHFNKALGSWEAFGPALATAFAAQDRYNLVIAPHIRMFREGGDRARAAMEALAIPDKILVDTGSPRLTDMTYTLGADVYIGDVSSQIYEFIATPRPCLFLNAHGADWRNDPNYACWAFGEVLQSVDGIVSAVERSIASRDPYRRIQARAAREAMGETDGAAARAATLVLAATRARVV